MRFNRRRFFLSATAFFSTLAAALAVDIRLEYPQTRRVDQVDVIHGVEVADPYRWLEDDVRSSPEVAAWAAEENRITNNYLNLIPQRKAIRERLTELWNYARYSAPIKRGNKYFFFKNDGLQNQAVLYMADSIDGEPRVLLDPNKWSEDGTVALSGLSISDDGRRLAHARSEAGSDWATWRILNIESQEELPEELKWTKFTGAWWTKDGKGFFYTRYDEPERGVEFQAANLNNKLCYHRLGTPQSDDQVVYWRPEHPEWLYSASVSDDGRYLVVSIGVGTDERNRVLVRDLSEEDGEFVELVDNFNNEYSFVGNVKKVLLFKTDLDAPRRRLIAIDLQQPEQKKWGEVIPQSDATMVDVGFVNHLFIVNYLQDVVSRVKVFNILGNFLHEVELPGVGSAGGFGGRQTDTETFYGFSSIATPTSIYRYDIASNTSRLWHRDEVDFNPDKYLVRQVIYTSKDGTRVPMFVAHRKDIKLDGSNPTLLYGYGGFNISLTPRFSIHRAAAWLDMGGVYAQPNLRGGGEFGEAWHEAGTKLKKQNVFDDFIAAAEWLIDNNYTRPEKLAIEGGSNGGLLVGAAMTQRPELFGACLPEVGVMDMLRFHKFTEGRLWVDDYGSAEDPKEFRALLAYSPYHNVKPGTCYPATLIATADTDDRVVPGHSFKFAAALQRAQACEKPVLISISTRAGHGGGKPVAKQIDELADKLAFLLHNLDMNAEGRHNQ
ncbi:MAG: S9 family peptidase [Pirellulales bacterium]|nr:S9 family peptidase [Pirellulales bacterium]